MNRARSDTGVTVVELLVVMSMLIVVLSATFKMLDSFSVATRANFNQNHAQSIARTTADRLARELRNVASPGFTGVPIERAMSNDLIFDMVDPFGNGGSANGTKVARVRYCLAVSERQIWRQVETWPAASRPSLPSTTDCPATALGSQRIIADHVVNGMSGQARPLFVYDSDVPADTAAVTVQIYTDLALDKPPGEQRLTTKVFLRNQNRAPVAAFTATLTGSRHVLLNGSASTDPDGDNLTFSWYAGGTLIGEGALLDYAAPTGGNQTFYVTVTDQSQATTTSASQTIDIS